MAFDETKPMFSISMAERAARANSAIICVRDSYNFTPDNNLRLSSTAIALFTIQRPRKYLNFVSSANGGLVEYFSRANREVPPRIDVIHT